MDISTSKKTANQKISKTIIAIIILTVLVCLCAAWGIYEHFTRIATEKDLKDAKAAQTTPAPTYHTPISPQPANNTPKSTTKQAELSDAIQKIFDNAVTRANITLDYKNGSDYYELSFGIRPEGALTAFSSPSYSYSFIAHGNTTSKEDAEKLQSALVQELTDTGYQPLSIFFETAEDKNLTGYINEGLDIVCGPIEFYYTDKYEVTLNCAKMNGIPLYSDYELAELNKKAQAYKDAVGEYPRYLTDYYSSPVSIYGKNGKSYEIYPGLTLSQFPEFFYQERNSDEWKFAGLELCWPEEHLNPEQESLFACVEQDGMRFLGLRGNF